MSKTVLTACRVPWAVSPTTSGLVLTHSESDVEPTASIVLGAGRLRDDDLTDDRRVEITFGGCFFSRFGPKSDDHGIESVGYDVDEPFPYDPANYRELRARIWRETGFCPDPDFYEARRSEWLATLPQWFQHGYHHYVVAGRDSFVEVIASRYRWREWIWSTGDRESSPACGPVVGEGESTA